VKGEVNDTYRASEEERGAQDRWKEKRSNDVNSIYVYRSLLRGGAIPEQGSPKRAPPSEGKVTH